MRALSPTLRAALLGDHEPISKITVRRDAGELGITFGDVELIPIDGVVRVGDGIVRRTLECTLIDPDGGFTPAGAADLLAPRRHRIEVARGARTSAGPEYCLLGSFLVTKARVFETRAGIKVHLSANQFWSRKIQLARLTKPYNVPANAQGRGPIGDFLSSRVAGLQFKYPGAATGGAPDGLSFATGDDPLEKAVRWAEALGCELFEDPDGIIVIQPIPDIAQQAPVWEYTDYSRNLLDAEKELDDERFYNHVVVTGEPPDRTPVYGEWLDDDPFSHTFIGVRDANGAYPNDVPYFYTSRFITTTEQANAVARAFGRVVSGVTESVRILGLPNPAHERHDVVTFSRERLRVGGTSALDTFSIPLVYSQGMPADLRKRALR